MEKENPGERMESCLEEKLNELEILKQSLVEKEELAKEHYRQLLRLKAEFENYRKRMEKEKASWLASGKESIILDMLPVLDSFEQGISHMRLNADDATREILKGTEMIFGNIICMLEKEGVRKIETIGKRFDPDLHHAVQYKESSSDQDGGIIEEITAGYMLGNRLLRPAMVIVAKSTDKCSNPELDSEPKDEI